MCKRAKIKIIKTFGKEDLQKILKKIIKNKLMKSQIIISNNLRDDN